MSTTTHKEIIEVFFKKAMERNEATESDLQNAVEALKNREPHIMTLVAGIRAVVAKEIEKHESVHLHKLHQTVR